MSGWCSSSLCRCYYTGPMRRDRSFLVFQVCPSSRLPAAHDWIQQSRHRKLMVAVVCHHGLRYMHAACPHRSSEAGCLHGTPVGHSRSGREAGRRGCWTMPLEFAQPCWRSYWASQSEYVILPSPVIDDADATSRIVCCTPQYRRQSRRPRSSWISRITLASIKFRGSDTGESRSRAGSNRWVLR